MRMHNKLNSRFHPNRYGYNKIQSFFTFVETFSAVCSHFISFAWSGFSHSLDKSQWCQTLCRSSTGRKRARSSPWTCLWKCKYGSEPSRRKRTLAPPRSPRTHPLALALGRGGAVLAGMSTLGSPGLSSWPEPSSPGSCWPRSCLSCWQKTWPRPGTSHPCPQPGPPSNVSLRWSPRGPGQWPLCQSGLRCLGGPAMHPGVSPDVCPGKAATKGWLSQGPGWRPLQKHNEAWMYKWRIHSVGEFWDCEVKPNATKGKVYLRISQSFGSLWKAKDKTLVRYCVQVMVVNLKWSETWKILEGLRKSYHFQQVCQLFHLTLPPVWTQISWSFRHRCQWERWSQTSLWQSEECSGRESSSARRSTSNYSETSYTTYI